jgi:hypothetical protein
MIGPKMNQAVDYVARNPGCAILPVARYVGPHGSIKFGYRAVHRAIKAGLISCSPKTKGRYSLTVPA